jgi:DNA-binding NarL/FixJ family response regulator
MYLSSKTHSKPEKSWPICWPTKEALRLSAKPVREALAGIEATLPEAVLLDISLPDGSGVEVLKFIRLNDLNLSVVVLTSNPYDALRTKCQSLGAAAVLDKLEGLDQVRQALLTLSPRLKVN